MHSFFDMQKNTRDNQDPWLSLINLMLGLMMVFFFIAIVFMSNNLQDKVKSPFFDDEIQNETQASIYYALQTEFQAEILKWNAHLDKNTLSFDFLSSDLYFIEGGKRLSENYEKILSDFFPRYINVIKKFRDDIEELRIEAHTSTNWKLDSTEEEAYFNNLRLSQIKTGEVFQFVYSLVPKETYWIKRNVIAVGFSSSKARIVKGIEDIQKSKRISFRVILEKGTFREGEGKNEIID